MVDKEHGRRIARVVRHDDKNTCWEEVPESRQRIPNSVRIFPSTGGAGHYSYVVASYRIIEKHLVNGQEEVREREIQTDPVYDSSHPDGYDDVAVLIAAAIPILGTLESRCFANHEKKRSKRSS